MKKTQESPTLVVGSTGDLGGKIVRGLAEAGVSVRAMVRGDVSQKPPARGVELVKGDLKVRASLVEACRGVSTVISTATATRSRLDGDSIETVDHAGQLSLVEVAEKAGVERFLFVSFVEFPHLNFALQRAKRAVEHRLQKSGMDYTIFRPTFYMEEWLSPMVGFDFANGKARVFGGGNGPVTWASVDHVARYAVEVVRKKDFRKKIITIGGADTLTQRRVVSTFESVGHRTFDVTDVPEAELERQLTDAPDQVQQAFAAFMLAIARGKTVESSPHEPSSVGASKTVSDFARSQSTTPPVKGATSAMSKQVQNPAFVKDETIIIVADDGSTYVLNADDWKKDKFKQGGPAARTGAAQKLQSDNGSVGIVQQLIDLGVYLAYIPPSFASAIGCCCTLVNLGAVLKNQGQ
jgi:uncharacterized protein YbjT (DUF2867 family)